MRVPFLAPVKKRGHCWQHSTRWIVHQTRYPLGKDFARTVTSFLLRAVKAPEPCATSRSATRPPSRFAECDGVRASDPALRQQLRDRGHRRAKCASQDVYPDLSGCLAPGSPSLAARNPIPSRYGDLMRALVFAIATQHRATPNLLPLRTRAGLLLACRQVPRERPQMLANQGQGTSALGL
jgi:hypothetical protein